MRGLVFALIIAGLLPFAAVRPMAGILLWEWISFMSPQQELWGFAQAMPWAWLVVAATGLGCVVAREPRRPNVTPMVWLLLLFMLGISLTTATALGPAAAVVPKYIQEMKSFVLMILTALLLSERKRIHAVVWIMALSLGYYGVRGGLFSLLTAGHFHVYGPPNSILGDNNQLAAALLVGLPLMNYLRLQSAHAVVRQGLAAAMMLVLFSILTSYSRGAFLGLGAVSLFFWWKSRRKLVSAIAVVLAVGLAITFMPPAWMARMMTILHYQHSQSAQERLAIWGVALRVALARPFTGGGLLITHFAGPLHSLVPGAVHRAVHSIWFEILGENGFVVFAIWACMLLVGVYNCLRIQRLTRAIPELGWANDLGRMGFVSIIAYCSAGSFLSLGYYDLFFTLLVVLAATRSLVAQALRERAPPRVPVPSAVHPPALAAAGWRGAGGQKRLPAWSRGAGR